MPARAKPSLLFAWHDARNFIRRVYEGAMEANVPFLASGLTFDALLAAIPLALLALSLVGYLLSAQAGAAQVELSDYVRRFLPRGRGAGPDPFAPIIALLEGVVRSRGTLGLLGLPLFVWFSTRLFGSLRATLNEVFDTEETRSWLRGKGNDIALALVTGLLFVLNTALTQGLEVVAVLGRRFGLGFVPFLGAQVLAFVSIVGLFVLIFRYAPARGCRWDTALVAALTCTAGFEGAKLVLAWYFEHFVRPDTFVSDARLGALFVFVAWTYYMTYVFLIGGQIAQVYELRRRQAAQRALLSD